MIRKKSEMLIEGGLTFNGKRYRIDDMIHDEVLINIDFIMDGLSKDDKERIGATVIEELEYILTERERKS